MQQRVGLVRALAIDPEILLMDEPFAALDAQTREVLQEELLRIMQDERKTMVFITHSIDEAILLGDRIAVMSARPGRIKEILDVPFGRPRDVNALRADPRFAELRAHIWNELRAPQPPRRRDVGAGRNRAATTRTPSARARSTSRPDAQAPPRAADARHPRRLGRGRAGAVAICRLRHRSGAVHDAGRGRAGRLRHDRAAASCGTISGRASSSSRPASPSRRWSASRPGSLLARFWVIDVALGVYITFLYSIPAVALVPLIVLWAGFESTAKIIVLFLFAFFPMAINTYQGVKNVDPRLIEVGRSFRCSERQLWANIVLPGALPFIVTGLRLAVGRGLIGMVLADQYTAISGIGYLIVRTAATYQVDKMFVPIVTLGILGITLTALLRVLERRVAPWTLAGEQD